MQRLYPTWEFQNVKLTLGEHGLTRSFMNREDGSKTLVDIFIINYMTTEFIVELLWNHSWRPNCDFKESRDRPLHKKSYFSTTHRQMSNVQLRHCSICTIRCSTNSRERMMTLTLTLTCDHVQSLLYWRQLLSTVRTRRLQTATQAYYAVAYICTSIIGRLTALCSSLSIVNVCLWPLRNVYTVTAMTMSRPSLF